ncbi:hypothetical protein GM658_05510 [Pseudoduganella eburnea]|uniref:TonB family protein n=1 Tax=Massilia eburnea TaxID=1776165 RepID=A0A6L6QC42_9BURK|nr:TonB C-terminal domain-containing protein [Massilia eburnea]MTW10052.1 hypothetical protein [Massilia eburnea]
MSTAIAIHQYQRFQHEPWRLSTAVVISGLIHALLLSIALGGQTFGIPAFQFPWQERRLAVNDLQVLLMPSQTRPTTPALPEVGLPASSPEPTLTIKRSANALGDMPPAMSHSAPAFSTTSTPLSPASPAALPDTDMPAAKIPDIPLPTAPAAPPVALPANPDPVRQQLQREDPDATRERARLEQEQLVADKLRQSELVAEAQREAMRQEQMTLEVTRAEQAVKLAAAQLDTERQEQLRREALRLEQARLEESARQELLQQEAVRAAQVAKAEAVRKEAERLELARQEKLRQETIQQEQARQVEKARQDAALQEQVHAQSAQLDAERREAARQEQMRQEAARQAQQEAAKQEAARLEKTRQEQVRLEKERQEAEHEERLRAIGRQLNEEAAQRDAALKNPSRSLLPTVSGLRRGWLFGRADTNGELVQYAETISKKFELNMAFDMLRDVVKQRHVSPMVTIAIRADGSVENVTFVVSSGVSAIDDAIRKVIATQAPYGAFPPGLARQYDVLEIRRTWVFDTAIRLQ